MKLVSWNVNGLRSALQKGFLDFLKNTPADVYCLQEVRALPEDLKFSLDGYELFWNPAEKKGYSGVAIFTRQKPLQVTKGLGMAEHDREGRVLTAEFDDFFLVNVYTPNSQRELTRLDYRTNDWDKLFLEYCRGLEKKKPVIFCGDLNVAHKEIDLANPKANKRNAGFTEEERRGFDAIVASGFIDTFREFTQDGGHYTWWSNFANSRARNIGWRIDYFCVSSSLRRRLQAAEILPHIMGSDHCPVTLEIQS
jgi:exodeoxyribonuclease-3